MGASVSTASCSAPCGVDDGLSYAGAEAYSNGAFTGTLDSCNGTGSYGYQYQCVEFVTRVNRRTDWTGNAFDGYWGSTGTGPYQKGLLPLGSGIAYVPPLHGDLLVWKSGSAGHIGLIAAVGTTSMTVYDQNRQCGSQTCAAGYANTGGAYTLANGTCFSGATYTPVGYLRRGWDFSAAFGLVTSESATNWRVTNASYKGGTTSGSMTAIDDYVTIGPAGAYPALISPKGLALPAYSSAAPHGYRTFSVRLQSGCANKSAWLLWRRTTDATFNVGRAVQTTFGSGWVTLTFNLSAHSDWNGTIDQLWLSPSEQCSTGEINIAYTYFGR